MRRSRAEPDEIDDLEDAESVNDEKGDEPPFLAISCSVPERVALNDDCPGRGENEKRHKSEHES